MTHTPGPWQAIGSAIEDCAEPRTVVAFANDNGPTESEERANARLIAAAPDLLAALEKRLKPDVGRTDGLTECGECRALQSRKKEEAHLFHHEEGCARALVAKAKE